MTSTKWATSLFLAMRTSDDTELISGHHKTWSLEDFIAIAQQNYVWYLTGQSVKKYKIRQQKGKYRNIKQ